MSTTAKDQFNYDKSLSNIRTVRPISFLSRTSDSSLNPAGSIEKLNSQRNKNWLNMCDGEQNIHTFTPKHCKH